MRSREEIERDLEAIIRDFKQVASKFVYADYMRLLAEVLLDIRDLLREKR